MHLRGGGFLLKTAVFYDSPILELQSVGPSVEPTSPKVRKEFPETWIWDDLNEEGFVSSFFFYLVFFLNFIMLVNESLCCSPFMNSSSL